VALARAVRKFSRKASVPGVDERAQLLRDSLAGPTVLRIRVRLISAALREDALDARIGAPATTTRRPRR
jgi:hypothetical protein